MITYRSDIDGLRALAVIPVIIFHFGFLRNGYLGVDIFFVISGFLITSIIRHDLEKGSFSIKNFYLRRIRRIFPLTFFTCLVALLIGVVLMLPDDLENLAQSIVATLLFGNNVLLAITTKDYWAVANEYKPLMHTWSLGVEEQYYFIYPFIFLLVKSARGLMLTLTSLSAISLSLLLFGDYSAGEKFYYLPFRFFELGLGGILAIQCANYRLSGRFSPLWLGGLIVLLFSGLFENQVLVLLVTVLTGLVLVTNNTENRLSRWLLENRGVVFLGKISFSLYLWHQIVIAFGRYAFIETYKWHHVIAGFAITFGLSVFTYKLVEQTFRNKNVISTPRTLAALGCVFVLLLAGSLSVYFRSGVLKDFPELNFVAGEVGRGEIKRYCDRIYAYDRSFTNSNNQIKVYVYGNSLARDLANVLLESGIAPLIQVSYRHPTLSGSSLAEHENRIREADILFVQDDEFLKKYDVNPSRVFRIGVKNYGYTSGIFYNNKGEDYCQQRTKMRPGYLDDNQRLQEMWGDQYIDFITPVLDENETIPVFSDDCKLISYDCTHFTQGGAMYYSRVLRDKIESIFLE